MCIVHKGFRGFRAASPASILGGKLIGLKSAIPYDTIHSPLCIIKRHEDTFNYTRNIDIQNSIWTRINDLQK